MAKLKDRTGERYGRLVVLKRGPDHICPSGRKVVQWICQCDCGNITTVATTSLGRGLTKSCGCYNLEQQKNSETKHHTHGLSNTRLYSIWRSMKKRCYNETNDNYYLYGGRGIEICPEWKEDFQAFYDWAINNGYDEALTIDRIDSNDMYSPENCRWSDNTEQQRNKRNNRLITFNGETHCLAEWAEITGINRSTISDRIDKYNWPIERALTEPPRH